MSRRMRILALEPYYGGSHRSVLDLLVSAVDAEWTLLTLPARKWKWRMRGAAMTMAEEVRRIRRDGGGFDLIFASTFLNLAEFRGLAGDAVTGVPAIVYFHENQLLYPNRHLADWDFQFPLTNITTALSADSCLFNSRWNLEGFLSDIPGFIKEFPDHHPHGVAEAIAAKSVVLAPPFDPAPFDSVELVRGKRCRIVWPHRWEHDKDPEEFFAAVGELASEGLDFEVAVAGQAFAETSGAMRDAASVLGDRLVHCGEPEDRSVYARLLRSSDVAVSTAVNEFFGLAMMEACYAGCSVIVPDRLVYPELYPPESRYADRAGLVALLRDAVLHRPAPLRLRLVAEEYTIVRLAPLYEAEFKRIAGMRPGPPGREKE